MSVVPTEGDNCIYVFAAQLLATKSNMQFGEPYNSSQQVEFSPIWFAPLMTGVVPSNQNVYPKKRH